MRTLSSLALFYFSWPKPIGSLDCFWLATPTMMHCIDDIKQPIRIEPAVWSVLNKQCSLFNRIPLSLPLWSSFWQACTRCPAGQECKNTTIAGTPCVSGYYSLEGSYSCTPCPKGYKCPVKNDVPQICAAGKYSDASSLACSDCDAGYVCVEGSTSKTPDIGLCPLGYYCEDKINKVACPAGTYGKKTGGQSQADACEPCPPGFYCEAGTPGYPKYSVRCPPGHYCPISTQTASEHPCPDGTYNTDIRSESVGSCKDCRPGYYCTGGDATGDSLCPAGHYCLHKTTSDTQYPCDAGYYTEERGATSKIICFSFVQKSNCIETIPYIYCSEYIQNSH